MKTLPRIVVVALCLMIMGCFGTDEEQIVVAELVDFEASLVVKKAWHASLGQRKDELRLGLSPATNGARIFAAGPTGVVAAFDAVTGKPVWRVNTSLPLAGGPGAGRDAVALGSAKGDVLLLAAEDGRTIWTINVGSEVLATPAIGAGVVAVRTVDGRLLGIDLRDGSEIWQITHPVQGLTLRGTAAPAISGDVVICGFDDGRVSAVNLSDGEVLWETTLTEQRGRTALDRLADVDARVAVVAEDIFVSGYQGSTALLSLVTGQPVWRQDISSHNDPGLDWNRVYVTSADDAVLALRRSSGVTEWSQNKLSNRQISGPAPVGRAIAVGDFEGYVHWLGVDDGEFVARKRAGDGAITAPPLVVGNMIYVQTARGDLTAFVIEDAGS